MLRTIKRVLMSAKQQDDLPTRSVTLAKRLCKYGDTIFRFLFEPAVLPTNNGGERSIRQMVIDRRIAQGSRSLMGRQWNARIWAVLSRHAK
ncbi:MAG: transposase [Phycisphaerales bacterium]|nr:MAG: transposase [Phycisphaerales bacterium]